MEYMVIEVGSLISLNNIVNVMIRDGWTPVSGFQVVVIGTEIRFYQPLILRNKNGKMEN